MQQIHWVGLEQKMDSKEEQKIPLYQMAELDMSNHSLKEFDLVQYEKNLVIHLNSFDVLIRLYSSRQYGKRQFLFQQKTWRFQGRFLNKAIKSFTEAAAGNDVIVAYGNESFLLIMKTMGSGDSVQKRLMMMMLKAIENDQNSSWGKKVT